jgi:transposase
MNLYPLRSASTLAGEDQEDLRRLYRINPDNPAVAAAHLARWTRRAAVGAITAFATLARRLRQHRHGILNTIRLGLSNSVLEGVNAGVRLLQRRAHGYRRLDNLIEMVHYCYGGITPQLPTNR